VRRSWNDRHAKNISIECALASTVRVAHTAFEMKAMVHR